MIRRVAIGAGVIMLALASCVLFDPLSGFSDGAEDAGAEDAGADGEAAREAAAPGDAFAPSDSQSPSDAAPDAPIAMDAGLPSFVQAQSASALDASTAAATFDASVGVGDTILVAVDYSPSPAALVSVNDTQNDVFKVVFTTIAPTGIHFYVAAAFNVLGGPSNVSVQLDGPAPEIELYVHEYANLSAFGVAGVASGTTKQVDGMQSPLVSTTVPDELLFGYGISVAGGATSGTGFTRRSSFHSNFTEDRMLGGPGAYRATGTMLSGTDWTIIAATFKPR